VERFVAHDDRAPPPAGQIVVTGSSSIRRWPTATMALAPWGVVQRGIGGARLGDIAAHAPALILRHHPSAVLLFAGTNDVADGVPVDDVVDAWRCVVQQVFSAQGPTAVFFIGITPVPAREAVWPASDAVNDAVRADAEAHPLLHYVDMPAAFFATGTPPAAELFDPDGIHLSTTGYALWTDAIVEALDAAGLPERARPASTSGLPAGQLVRVDLGPDNVEDGRAAPAVDSFGIHWNSWPGNHGNDAVLAGEAIRQLVTTTGAPSNVALTLAGGFRGNGLRNGGLTDPPGIHLGTMAVPEATGDFFFIGTDADDPGALTLSGLRPLAPHTLRFFASRASDEETRITRYVVVGADPAVETTLVTTGRDIGDNGRDGNDRHVAVVTGVRADVHGEIHVDVDVAAGRFAYLSLLELQAE
jgi:lysophospholipase L1-like esterase